MRMLLAVTPTSLAEFAAPAAAGALVAAAGADVLAAGAPPLGALALVHAANATLTEVANAIRRTTCLTINPFLDRTRGDGTLSGGLGRGVRRTWLEKASMAVGDQPGDAASGDAEHHRSEERR